MRIADVHVNLRGFRRVMSQQSLDVAQIGACLQQMRGKRMAQLPRRAIFLLLRLWL